MRKLISLLFFAIAIALPVLSAASEKFTQMARIEFGYALNPDGTKRSLKGLVIPITLEKIDAKAVSTRSKGITPGTDFIKGTAFDRTLGMLAPNPFVRSGGERRNLLMAESYVSDNPGSYFYINPAEFSDPSALDGINMVGGAGRPWQEMTWGLYLEVDRKVLLRIRLYSTYNSGAPAGTSAFTGEFADFGFYIESGNYGSGVDHAYRLSAPISNAGVTSPNNQLYMALQYRVPHLVWNPLLQQWVEDGEGAFDEAFRHVYSATAPSVGTSEDNYWFDWDPLDGIYANEEFDVLGDGQTTYPSNFLSRVTVNSGGSQDTLLPFVVRFLTGSSPTGNFINLWYSDNGYVTVKRGIVLNPAIDPMQVEAETVSPASTVNSLTFKYEIATTTAGSPVKVFLFNYVTGVYDLVATHTSSGTDQTFQVLISSNPSKYINPADNAVKAKITFRAIPTLNSSWNARIDLMNWIITR